MINFAVGCGPPQCGWIFEPIIYFESIWDLPSKGSLVFISGLNCIKKYLSSGRTLLFTEAASDLQAGRHGNWSFLTRALPAQTLGIVPASGGCLPSGGVYFLGNLGQLLVCSLFFLQRLLQELHDL